MPESHPNTPSGPLRTADVQRRFDRAAERFADHDFVHRRSFDGLLDRLEPVKLEPRQILDLGSAAGAGSRRLAKLFRSARVTSVDLSGRMLRVGRSQRSRFARVSEVQADAAALPFATGAFDLVVANQLLPWIGDLQPCFAGIARVLREGGLFLFATLGPDSLMEVRDAWSDRGAHVNPFIDMHDVGDALVQSGLRDPVVDMERLTVSYSDVGSLFDDLTASGARNCLRGRSSGLTGKRRFRQFVERLRRDAAGAELSISLELVFGHAWGGGPPPSAGEYRVDASRIGRLRR